MSSGRHEAGASVVFTKSSGAFASGRSPLRRSTIGYVFSWIFVLALVGSGVILASCAPRLGSAARSFAEHAPSNGGAREVATAAALESERGGYTPIMIDSAEVVPSKRGSEIRCRVVLSAAADSVDSAFRAADYTTLLFPALLRNTNVTAIELDFCEENVSNSVVTMRYDKEHTGAVDWSALRSGLDRSTGDGWLPVFDAVTSYEWRNREIWEGITATSTVGRVDATALPVRK